MSSPLLPHHCSHLGQFDAGNPLAERKTRLAIVLTLLMMVAEIVGGWYFNSMIPITSLELQMTRSG